MYIVYITLLYYTGSGSYHYGSLPNQQSSVNKFQLSSQKSVSSFLEQNLGQILSISADCAYILVPNIDKDVGKVDIHT